MKIGQVQESEKGNFYLKLGVGVMEGSESAAIASKLITALGTDVLFLQRPQDQIDFLAGSGKLTTAEAEARKAKLPTFVRYNVNVGKGKN